MLRHRLAGSIMTAIVPWFLRFAALALRAVRRVRSVHVVACVLAASVTIGAAACPLSAPRTSVTDPAAVLGAHAGAIAARLAAWQRTTGHQLFVVIAPSLDDGMSVEQCAVSVFQKWKIGRKGVDDGVLLLVAIRERKMRIEVGYGLEGVLTDAKSARIIREVMKPLFAHGDLAEGVERGLDAIMALIEPAGPARKAATVSSIADDAQTEMIGKFVVTGLGLMVFVVSAITGFIGLFFFGMPIIGIVYYSYPDWRGWLFAGAYVLAWCALRWLIIRGNVRKYHLQESRHKPLTWLRCFVAAGLAGPDKKPERKPEASSKGSAVAEEGSGVSFSFADSGDSSGDTGSSDTGSSDTSSCDSGGASGGGGASDDW
jgi:uncharacterized membrane protein YgcG